MNDLVLVGRSSSHFTRTARIFALELDVAYTFRPVFDIMAIDAAIYGDNPALKVPVLIDAEGPLFGTENICRAIARRSARGSSVVLRGAIDDRVVANAEELILHVMSSEVSIILAKIAGDARLAPPKVMRSLEGSLRFLEENLDRVLAALPTDRALSFVEVALFATMTHLPFRQVMDVASYTRLGAFTQSFGERESAKATEYRFDSP